MPLDPRCLVGCNRHWSSEAHKVLGALLDQGAKEKSGNSGYTLDSIFRLLQGLGTQERTCLLPHRVRPTPSAHGCILTQGIWQQILLLYVNVKPELCTVLSATNVGNLCFCSAFGVQPLSRTLARDQGGRQGLSSHLKRDFSEIVKNQIIHTDYLGIKNEFSNISFIDKQGRTLPEFYTWGNLQFTSIREGRN